MLLKVGDSGAEHAELKLHHRLVDAAERRRDGRDRQPGKAGGDSRDDTEGYSGFGQGECLLAATAKDEGIAPFQAEHPAILAGPR